MNLNRIEALKYCNSDSLRKVCLIRINLQHLFAVYFDIPSERLQAELSYSGCCVYATERHMSQ